MPRRPEIASFSSMTARKPLTSALLLVLAGSAAAGLFWRDKVSSRWTPAPLRVDADDSDWDESSSYEQEGLSLQARNDADDLYLLVTAHTREAREQLVGESKQDLALWFLAADGKTREWGARLPYGRREPLASALRDPAGVDPRPELVRWQGGVVSSETWPSELSDRLASAGRRPVWELKVPLKRLSLTPERIVHVDLALSAPTGAAAAARRRRNDEPGPDGRGRREKGAGPPGYDPPGPVTLLMSLRLAGPPEAAR